MSRIVQEIAAKIVSLYPPPSFVIMGQSFRNKMLAEVATDQYHTGLRYLDRYADKICGIPIAIHHGSSFDGYTIVREVTIK